VLPPWFWGWDDPLSGRVRFVQISTKMCNFVHFGFASYRIGILTNEAISAFRINELIYSNA
jgi:hypothetical protein